MDKQTNLRKCIARHTLEVLELFPKKARTWYAIPANDSDRISDFMNEYGRDVDEILVDMAVECIEIEKSFKKVLTIATSSVTILP